jgi:hypothetical protein
MRHPAPRIAGPALLVSAAIYLGGIGAAGGIGAYAAAPPPARAAKTLSINDHGALHLISKHGFTLNEQGSASGTIAGPIHVVLKIVSSNRVTAEVTISPKGGSLSGEATASYHKGETEASFSGTLAVNHGSGSYNHAQGSGLSFKGTIASSNDAITVSVSGRLSD